MVAQLIRCLEALLTIFTTRECNCFLGENNLSKYKEPEEEPESVLEQVKDLVGAIGKPENQPLVECTVLRRTKPNHSPINNFSELLVSPELSTFNLHRKVFNNQKFF